MQKSSPIHYPTPASIRKVPGFLTQQTPLVLAVLFLLLGAGLRLWDLSALPPGLNDDEIVEIRVAEGIRAGEITIFYEVDGEVREGLYHTVLAATTSVVGTGTVGFRMLSVWLGMLTLALVYALAARLYGPLAGVTALALLVVGMWPVILSRTIAREAAVPLLVSGVLLALAKILPVYRRHQIRLPHTTSLAVLGALLGFGLYVHPISVVIALASAAFIVYMVLSSQPMSRQTLNYVGFAVLVMIIIGMPYLISTIRTPELSGFGQLLGNYDASQQSLLQTIAAGLSGIIFRGDHNPAHNLPGRPLVDLVSGLLILLGLMVAIRFWRQPRFALPLIVTVLLAPVAFLTSNSPDFLAFSALLPLLALFFGLGVNLLFHSLRGMARRIGGAGLVALLAFNLLWLAGDLFEGWPQEAAVQTAYNHHLLQLSQYVEATATTIPTVMCTSNERLGSQIIQWMSSRPLPLRYAECQSGLVLAQGGETQQVILPEPEILEQTHPHLRDWLLRGTFVDAPGLPQESILTMNVVDQLADAVGRFTTTAPLRYAPEAPGETGSVIAPPVRFGGNVTFLGYALDETETYLPGETITAITYWRADGMIPPDLLLFTHVLSDPVSIIAQIDIINVDPRQLQDRDVFIQVTHVPLPAAIPEGDYLISVGAYQASSDVRLDVLEDNQPRGTRLFLYPIRVTDETGE